MKALNQYIIPLLGLAEGHHDFNMTLDDYTFKHFNCEISQKGEVIANIKLEKNSSFYKIKSTLNGWIELNCDRCLIPYKEKIKSSFMLILKHSEKEGEHMQGEIELKFISPESSQFNIGKDLFDYVLLSLPMKKCCQSKSCSAFVEKYQSSHDGDEIDPRWKELTKLK